MTSGSQFVKDEDTLNRKRAKLNVKMETIIAEQEAIIEASTKVLNKINKDLKALNIRLKAYLNGKNRDGNYEELKSKYESLLQQRMTLQHTINIAEESISAAKLHRVPGV